MSMTKTQRIAVENITPGSTIIVDGETWIVTADNPDCGYAAIKLVRPYRHVAYGETYYIRPQTVVQMVIPSPDRITFNKRKKSNVDTRKM